MASFDLGSLLGAKPAIVPVAVTTSNVNSVAVDTSGFYAVAFVSAVGSSNTNATINAVNHFWESNDNTIGNATRLSTSRVISNPVLNASNATFIASVVPTKRYVFTELDPAATFTATVSVSAVLLANEAPTQ
jgi:hypothetical protein